MLISYIFVRTDEEFAQRGQPQQHGGHGGRGGAAHHAHAHRRTQRHAQ